MKQITQQIELDFNTFPTRQPRRFKAPGRAEGEDGCLGICMASARRGATAPSWGAPPPRQVSAAARSTDLIM
jgi:hypothetical protein